MRKFFSFKYIPASFCGLYMLNNLSTRNAAKCIPEEEEDITMKEGQSLIDENDSELNQDDDFLKVLNDPSLSEEERAMLKRQMKQQSIQPFPFSKLHAPFKLGVDEEKWNGLRGVLEWSPNQINKMEYTLIVDNRKIFNKFNKRCEVIGISVN